MNLFTREPDYTVFKEALKRAITLHFGTLSQSLTGDHCVAYCLYTSDEVSSVGPVANRASALKTKAGDELYTYYRFSADEWSDWEDSGFFRDVNTWITQHSERKDYLRRIAPKLLTICIDALAEQKAAGVFGADSEERFLVVWVSDSNSSVVRESAERLNSADTYRAFASEFVVSE